MTLVSRFRAKLGGVPIEIEAVSTTDTKLQGFCRPSVHETFRCDSHYKAYSKDPIYCTSWAKFDLFFYLGEVDVNETLMKND